MKRWRRIRRAVLFEGLIIAACACASAEAWQPISNAMVAQALRLRGVEVSSEKIHLPMVSSRLSAPVLTVLDADRDAVGGLRVRIRCLRIADCVTFTAVLDVDGPDAEAALAALKPGGGEVQRVDAPRALLHAGARLVLYIEQQHLAARVPCVAIDTGAVGETIRVATLDRRTIFHAVVLGPMQARGVAE